MLLNSIMWMWSVPSKEGIKGSMRHFGPGGHDDSTPSNRLFIHDGPSGHSSSLCVGVELKMFV